MKRAVLWLSALLLVLVLAACGGASGSASGSASEPSWQELVDLGQKYLIELDYEQAILTFTQAIELEPQRGEAYIGRGDAYAALAADSDPTENYQNARADYEAGASYLAPSWELVEKLAEVYTAQGDTDALQELLEQAAGDLGSGEELDGLLDKYGYEQDENGVVQKKVQGDELLAELRHWSVGMYCSSPRPLSYYEQRLRPAVAQLQSLIDAEPERAKEYGAMLADVYYMLGEMDNVLETRRWLYELTGEEHYSPEGYTETRNSEVHYGENTYIHIFEVHCNEYGQTIDEILTGVDGDDIYNDIGTSYHYEYNERGQQILIRYERPSSGVWSTDENIYDTEGRIVQRITTASQEGVVGIDDYSYDGDQVHIVHNTMRNGAIQSSEERTGTLDAYNGVTYAY